MTSIIDARSPSAFKPIFTPVEGRPMHVVFFASGGPGNVLAAFAAEDAMPSRIRIGAVVTDRPGIPAIDVAEERRRPCLVHDFASECGSWAAHRGDPTQEDLYRQRAGRFHDAVLDKIMMLEQELGWKFDLAVLAYRRIITGKLLTYFEERMINQHPADLAVIDVSTARRSYVGIGGLARSLRCGERWTRTSTILVRSSVDAGEILTRGPQVEFTGDPEDARDVEAHEQRQKRLSDWPSLRFTLAGVSQGYYRLSTDERYPDGCKVVWFRGERLPYGGVELRDDR